MLVSVFGVPVEILAPDPATLARWRGHWSRALLPDDTVPAVRLDARMPTKWVDPVTSDYTLSSQVTLLALEHVKGSRVNLHAAGLSDDRGRVLALMAASGTGKTTAARILGRHLGYVSDETISVGAELEVLPYAKPLSVVLDAARPHHKGQHGPDELGLLEPPDLLRLRRLVILDRVAASEPHGVEPIGLAQALALMIPQISFVTSLETPLLQLTTLLQRVGGPRRLRYTEIADHADELRAFLASPLEESVEAAYVVHHPGATPSAAPPGTITRTPWQDAVELDDEVVVLVGPTSFQLGGIGATVWLALASPKTEAELLAIAEEIHGAHADSTRLLGEALGSLEERGIIERSSAEGSTRR